MPRRIVTTEPSAGRPGAGDPSRREHSGAEAAKLGTYNPSVVDNPAEKGPRQRSTPSSPASLRIALMGTRGIPARYGGFETFYEQLAPRLTTRGHHVTVYG